MDINRIQFNANIQQSKSQSVNVRRSFDMPNDSVSFSSKTKKQSLSILDRVKTFFSRTKTTYNSVNAGFEEHFYAQKKSIIAPVNLTDNQKKLLEEKITAFENYKAGLSADELSSLEKNKHGLLDFSIKDGLPDTSLSGYKKFLARYESFKKGDFSLMTNEELAQLIYYTDTTDLISDGKIGSFAQGRTGDCWFLSMLGNYASTAEGEANIASRISEPDINGTYTVTFDDFFDPNKKQIYKVTQKELQDYDLLDEESMFSSGDLDVRILEVATGKMLNDYILPMEKFSYYRDNDVFSEFKQYEPSCCIPEGNLEKQMLVHRALGYQGNVVQYVKKPENLDEHNILTEFSSKEFISNSNAQVFSVELNLIKENGKIKFVPSVKETEYTSLFDVIGKNNFSASELTASSNDEDYSDNDRENRYISSGHVFNVMDVNNTGSIVLNDPYNSAFPHTITDNDFERVFSRITHLPTK